MTVNYERPHDVGTVVNGQRPVCHDLDPPRPNSQPR